MILNKDTHPERKIYYLGSIILKIAKKYPGKKLNFFDLYQEVNSISKVKVSIISYTLALDWLYLLGNIKNDSGFIEKCF